MEVENFILDDSFLLRTAGTSDGSQDKYFKDDLWFKKDYFGGEGLAESFASKLLQNCGLNESDFVNYIPCKINGKQGCYSKNFLSKNETFVTFYRLYKNIYGRDLATVCSRMDYDDAIEYVISFSKEQTGLDIKNYLANIFTLDFLILNEDRHFNNFGLIYNEKEFRLAPIFDNGKSFFIGNKRAAEFTSLKEKLKSSFSKCFSANFATNLKYLKKYCTLNIYDDILKGIDEPEYAFFVQVVKSRIDELKKLGVIN